jgi:uncharacterized protein YjbI with pentapeptide repeats
MDNKASTEPDEVKKLQESFDEICNGSNKLSREYKLIFEAKKLRMEVEEYRRLYELRSKRHPLFTWVFRLIPVSWVFDQICFIWHWIGLENIWRWTGFGEKKLWDILQLLVVPVFLAGGAYYLQDTAKQTEQAQADRRAKTEQDLASDRNRQESLNKYFDTMTDLLLERKHRTSKERSEVLTIARARTLTTLRGLDKDRKGELLRFLFEAELIHAEFITEAELDNNHNRRMIVSLVEADLSGANLQEANLEEASLYDANLSNANLSNAQLNGADLFNAKLNGADLSNAFLNEAKLNEADLSNAKLNGAFLQFIDLSEAKLSGARLNGAKLQNTNLRDADLNNVDLSGANLRDTENFSKTQKDQAKLCNTILPDGTVSNRDCGK